MPDRADAGGGIENVVGPRFGQRDELLQRLRPEGRADQNDVRRRHHVRMLRELPEPVRQAIDSVDGAQAALLALLLAGPALSLPNMLVINSYLGPKKTVTYCGLVIVLAAATGFAYGAIVE